MYEAFYTLRTRPFSSNVPAAERWFPARTEESLRSASAALENGTDVLLITGSPGTGKTTLLRELSERSAPRTRGVLLSGADLNTPAALWRRVLFELEAEFVGLSDEDARLSVLQAARNLTPPAQALLLLIDDAHEPADDVLDELRRLAMQRYEGRAVVQVILCGTFELEERLAQPQLAVLQERVGQHVVLDRLTLEESRDYIAHRLASAGGTLEEAFSEEALVAICRTCDGNLRCLNQLCDHALLLGFVSEERPVRPETISAALDDLKGLPLPWNLPLNNEGRTTVEPQPVPATGTEGEANAPAESELEADDWWNQQENVAVIEVGSADLMTTATNADSDATQDAAGADQSSAAPGTAPGMPADAPNGTSSVIELFVQDRYAWLDRQAELSGHGAFGGEPWRASCTVQLVDPAQPGAAQSAGTPAEIEGSHEPPCLETQLVREVDRIRAELRSEREIGASSRTLDGAEPFDLAKPDPEWDVVQPEAEEVSAAPDIGLTGANDGAAAAATEARDSESCDRGETHDEQPAVEPAEQMAPRRYIRLFTRLRERRRDAERDRAAWPLSLWR